MKSSTLFEIANLMIDKTMALLGLCFLDTKDDWCPTMVYEDTKEIFSANDIEFLPTKEVEVEMKCGEKFVCDGIILFGDGCLEFHDKEDCDSYNWSEFTDESIIAMARVLGDMEKKNV